jgi:hypothetical protein
MAGAVGALFTPVTADEWGQVAMGGDLRCDGFAHCKIAGIVCEGRCIRSPQRAMVDARNSVAVQVTDRVVIRVLSGERVGVSRSRSVR